MTDVKIIYRGSTHIHPFSGKKGRPPVTFSTASCPFASSVTVKGHSTGGWVWANVFPTDSDQFEHLLIEGGTVELLNGFSGDDVNCEFRVTHDVTSQAIIITWNTRAD